MSLKEFQRHMEAVRSGLRQFGEAVIRERAKQAGIEYEEQVQKLRDILASDTSEGFDTTGVG